MGYTVNCDRHWSMVTQGNNKYVINVCKSWLALEHDWICCLYVVHLMVKFYKLDHFNENPAKN